MRCETGVAASPDVIIALYVTMFTMRKDEVQKRLNCIIWQLSVPRRKCGHTDHTVNRMHPDSKCKKTTQPRNFQLKPAPTRRRIHVYHYYTTSDNCTRKWSYLRYLSTGWWARARARAYAADSQAAVKVNWVPKKYRHFPLINNRG